MDQPDTHAQRDQQEWLAVADFEDEEEAGRAANLLQNEGIPAMIDQRATSAKFVLLVSTLQRDDARRALRELPAAKVIDDAT